MTAPELITKLERGLRRLANSPRASARPDAQKLRAQMAAWKTNQKRKTKHG